MVTILHRSFQTAKLRPVHDRCTYHDQKVNTFSCSAQDCHPSRQGCGVWARTIWRRHIVSETQTISLRQFSVTVTIRYFFCHGLGAE